MNNQRTLLLGLCAAIQFSHLLDFMLIMPLGNLLSQDLHIDHVEFGHIVASYTLSASVAGLAAAFAIDRLPRRKALLGIFLGFALSTLLCGVAPSYWTLLGARCLAGGFGGVLSGLVFTLVAEVFPKAQRGFAMGVLATAFSLASVLGVPAGVFFAFYTGSWQSPFLILGILSLGLWTLGLWVVPDVGPPVSQVPLSWRTQAQAFGKLVLDKQHALVLLFSALTLGASFLVIPFLTQFLVHNVGLTDTQVPFMYLVGGSFSLVITPLVGKLTDYFGPKRVFLTVTGLLSVVVPILTHLGSTPVPIAIGLCAAFMVCSSSRGVPSALLITGAVGPATRANFMSLNTCVQSLGNGIATTVAGLVLRTEDISQKFMNYHVVGYLSLACLAATLMLLPLLNPSDETSNGTPSQT